MKLHYMSGYLQSLVGDDLERIEKAFKKHKKTDLATPWGIEFVESGERMIKVEDELFRITLRSSLIIEPI